MSHLTSLFGSPWIVIPGVGLAVFFGIYYNAERIFNFLKEQSLGNREIILKKLDLMFVEVNERMLTTALLLTSFGLGFLSIIALWPEISIGVPLGVVLTVLGWRLPRIAVEMYFQKRCNDFVNQMVDGLTLMSNGLKSGLSIPQAMKLVVDHMPNPISQEFELMLSQNALGVSVEDVFNDLAKRIPFPDVQMFVTAVTILKDTGGNIAETFDTITKTIRERIKVEKKIAAVTAQGVMQGTIITIVPFALLTLFYFINPNYVAPLFNRTLGWIIIIMMLVLQILGGLMIRKIVRIKV